jgi:hypothetical protein
MVDKDYVKIQKRVTLTLMKFTKFEKILELRYGYLKYYIQGYEISIFFKFIYPWVSIWLGYIDFEKIGLGKKIPHPYPIGISKKLNDIPTQH